MPSPTAKWGLHKLKRIANEKKDDQEIPIAGQSFDNLPREQWPCCVDERATFMAPFEMEHEKKHALAPRHPEIYGHFLPTPQRYPAYSAGIVPFNWMMHENMEMFFEICMSLTLMKSESPNSNMKQTGFTKDKTKALYSMPLLDICGLKNLSLFFMPSMSLSLKERGVF